MQLRPSVGKCISVTACAWPGTRVKYLSSYMQVIYYTNLSVAFTVLRNCQTLDLFNSSMHHT